jgi:N-acetylglucosaminyldiphosphoundecaprenol N-acetyl-beta-D-mannosaminyltransferase
MSSKGEGTPVNLLGLKISLYPASGALDALYRRGADIKVRDIHFVNSFTVYLCQKDQQFEKVINSSWINLVDGKPLSWAARNILGYSALEQVRGPSLFRSAMLDQTSLDLSHYFIGGTAAVRDGLLEYISKNNPSLRVAGFECPPFRELTSAELAERDVSISNSGASVVWVGLGTPKQDFEARRIAESTGKIVLAVGAAFDFLSGTKPEAPKLIQSLGLEWLFRLLSEPKRLWKRYLVGNLYFLYTLARHVVCRQKSK